MELHPEYQRYQRQILLEEFGLQAQEKLLQAKVLMIGAGGLGCPCLLYLCAAGIGQIGIVDGDQVELSNLHRQILFTQEDIGKNKAICAQAKLHALNPEIIIKPYREHINQKNAFSLISAYDLVIDGSDNYATRYMVNDACMILKKPLIYGAVQRFEGQIGVFNVTNKNDGLVYTYRDLFPQTPLESFACNEVGVLGVLPGIIGLLQATEALKYFSGLGELLAGKIFTLNLKNHSNYNLELSKAEASNTNIPQDEASFLQMDYQAFCGTKGEVQEMEASEFESHLQNEDFLILDVREKDELPRITAFKCKNLPLSQLEKTLNPEWLQHKTILVCNTGIRSAAAYHKLKDEYKATVLYSLKGGLLALHKV